MADGGKIDGRLVFDCLSAVLLVLVAVLGAYMPKYLARKGSLQQGTASSLAFHLGNMLSGGVMLSAGFCHLLADALRQLAFLGRFPIAPFLAAVGYLITLLADQIVQLLTTDAEGQTSHMPSPQPGPGDQGLQHRHGSGFGPSAEPSPAPGFGFWRGGASNKAWGYSRLEDSQQLQQQQQGQQDGDRSGTGIELIPSNSMHCSSTAALGPAAAAAAEPGRVLDGSLQQHTSFGCCHAPAACPCCLARSTSDAEGSRSTAGPLNPIGFSRRPGSAGGLARAGLGLGSVARTRSLTSPSAVPALTPLQAAAALELHGQGQAAAADGPLLSSPPLSPSPPAAAGSGDSAAAAAAAVVPRPLRVSTPGLSSVSVEDATCLLAAGSPRSISAAGLHPRSPKVRPASVLAHHHQQQQQQFSSRSDDHYQQQQQQQQQQLLANGHHHSQQQQPPHGLHPELQRANSSIAQLLLQPVCQPSLPPCGCCCGGGGCRSALPSAQPDMTEACTVARVAGHLELEVMSTATGGHNHAHFQVFLSQRPLSFATSLLLACALCIHSILEGLALGAQQSMQATEDIMLAIAAHKGLAAYALGASIVESGASDSKFWVVVCLFAAATPLGISIGYASSVLGHGPVSAAMSALASGTFLYVALNEVIPKELEHPDGHRLAKVAALLLGFGLMSLLAVWA